MICYSLFVEDQIEFALYSLERLDSGQLVELRLDRMQSVDPQTIQNLISRIDGQVILTLRSVEHGGESKLSLDERHQTLLKLAGTGATYIDLEWPQDVGLVERFGRKKIILSYHQFQAPMPDLEGTLQKMRRTKAHLYKIAVQVASSIDTLNLMLFSRQAGEDVLAIAMGSLGANSRILSPYIRNRWCYVPLDGSSQTGPGQLQSQELNQIYRFDRIHPNIRPTALIGNPVAHSLGHKLHNGVFDSEKIDSCYVKISLEQEELLEGVKLLQQLGFRGISVTAPHKISVFPAATDVEPQAKGIGAINTLTFDGMKIIGTNTDGEGALDAIEERMKVCDKSLLIIGASGAARSLAFEAKRRGAKVFIASRTFSKVEALSKELGVKACSLDKLGLPYDLVINATSSTDPIPSLDFAGSQFAMDLSYNPSRTPFLERAISSGCQPIYGKEMFLHQAIGQLKRWFGIGPSVDSLRKLVVPDATPYRRTCKK